MNISHAARRSCALILLIFAFMALISATHSAHAGGAIPSGTPTYRYRTIQASPFAFKPTGFTSSGIAYGQAKGPDQRTYPAYYTSRLVLLDPLPSNIPDFIMNDRLEVAGLSLYMLLYINSLYKPYKVGSDGHIFASKETALNGLDMADNGLVAFGGLSGVMLTKDMNTAVVKIPARLGYMPTKVVISPSGTWLGVQYQAGLSVDLYRIYDKTAVRISFPASNRDLLPGSRLADVNDSGNMLLNKAGNAYIAGAYGSKTLLGRGSGLSLNAKNWAVGEGIENRKGTDISFPAVWVPGGAAAFDLSQHVIYESGLPSIHLAKTIGISNRNDILMQNGSVSFKLEYAGLQQ